VRHLEVAIPPSTSRRRFVQTLSLAATTAMFSEVQFAQASSQGASTAGPTASALDAERMRSLAAWTALTLETPNPVPFGAEIVDSKSGESLMRAANAVGKEHDPSAHAEVRTIRLACSRINSYSLKGYTLYTTCEPCPMCMACALWARLDRVVYGATIADAARFGHQIQIPAAEVAKRSDMACVVDGPVERDRCFALFTNPNMQKTFKIWNSEKP
jgi:tRNA(Arg) A34 adenosine deaminase TadA